MSDSQRSPVPSQLFVILGAGGVGKTTTAAALAASFAQQGKRAVVITVDPAKRLAQVLGLESLSNIPREVMTFENGGRLSALWLDTQSFFEDLVNKYAGSKEKANTILNNRLFKIIQSQLGGIEEYLGVEKVISLGRSGDYDVCILDTPPSRHALDFLESPRHILKFFDKRVLAVFMGSDDKASAGTSFFGKLFAHHSPLDLFKNFLGGKFLGELSELLQSIKPVYEIFMQTAEDIERWVRDPATRFVAVSSLEPYPLDEVRLLTIELHARELARPQMLVLNKCLPNEPTPSLNQLTEAMGSEPAAHLLQMAEAQQRMRQNLAERLGLQDPTRAASLVIAEVLRYSSKHLSQEQLLNMGTGILKTWLSKDPTLFSHS